MALFDDTWVEVYRATSGRIVRAEVCGKSGQRVNLPITHYRVSQDASDLGTAELHIFHGRVEYKDA